MEKLAGIIAVLGMTVSCGAQERVEPTKAERVESVRPDQRMLSEVLPESLAEFVRRAGSDRALDDATAEQVQSLDALEPDPEAMINILRPTDHSELRGPVTLLESAAFDEEQTLLVAGSTVSLMNDGVEEVEVGGELFLGEVVGHGLVLNAGDSAVLLETAAGETVSLGSGEILFVHLGGRCAHSCTVVCNPTHYACCKIVDPGCASCKCVINGLPDTSCSSGGSGSPSCSITAQAPD